MKNFLKPIWTEDQGVLTFEWILLLTLLTIGIVSGLTAVRDALIDELADVAEATVAIDQSYTLGPDPCFNTGGFSFVDPAGLVVRCERTTDVAGQPGATNCDFGTPAP